MREIGWGNFIYIPIIRIEDTKERKKEEKRRMHNRRNDLINDSFSWKEHSNFEEALGEGKQARERRMLLDAMRESELKKEESVERIWQLVRIAREWGLKGSKMSVFEKLVINAMRKKGKILKKEYVLKIKVNLLKKAEIERMIRKKILERNDISIDERVWMKERVRVIEERKYHQKDRESRKR